MHALTLNFALPEQRRCCACAEISRPRHSILVQSLFKRSGGDKLKVFKVGSSFGVLASNGNNLAVIDTRKGEMSLIDSVGSRGGEYVDSVEGRGRP